MSAVITRRTASAGVGIASMAAVGPSIASAAPVDSSAWDCAFALYEAARIADDRFYNERLVPVQERAPVCAAFHPYQVGKRRGGEPLFHRFTRDELRNVESSYAWSKNKGWIEAKSALDRYEAEYAAFDASTGYAALSAESERLNEAFANAEEALLLTPAPHVSAICVKIGILTTGDGRMPYDNPLVILALRSDAEKFV